MMGSDCRSSPSFSGIPPESISYISLSVMASTNNNWFPQNIKQNEAINAVVDDLLDTMISCLEDKQLAKTYAVVFVDKGMLVYNLWS